MHFSARYKNNEIEFIRDNRYTTSTFGGGGGGGGGGVGTGLHAELNMQRLIIVSEACTTNQAYVTWLANFKEITKL